MAINRQPLFTANPILEVTAFDPEIPTSVYETTSVTPIYEDMSTHGSLITKITVNSPIIDLGDKSTLKRIYLMISDSGNKSKYSMLDSKLMQGTGNYDPTLTDPPSVVFEFPTGLVTSPTTVLALASTMNRETSGFNGDRVTVIVEGGTYDQPA